MKIEDGTGSGRQARVDTRNRLQVGAVVQSSERFSNFTNGEAWSFIVSQTPTGAGDYFFYYKNNEEVSITFEGLGYRVASAEQIEVFLNSAGTPGGSLTTLVPVNLNTSSSKELTADIHVSNDITGLTDGDKAYKIFCTSTEQSNFNFEADIIVGPGGILALKAVTGGVQIDLNMVLYRGEV